MAVNSTVPTYKNFADYSPVYPNWGEYTTDKYKTPEAQRLFVNNLSRALASENKGDWANRVMEMHNKAVGLANPKSYGATGAQSGAGIANFMDKYIVAPISMGFNSLETDFRKDPALKRIFDEQVKNFPTYYEQFLTQRNAPPTPYVNPWEMQAKFGNQASAAPITNPDGSKVTPMGIGMGGGGGGTKTKTTTTDTAITKKSGGVSGRGVVSGTPTKTTPSGFDADKSRAEAARKLKKESDAEFAQRLAEERALFNQRVSPLERQMAGMPEQLAAKEFQTMRTAFQNLANRGMLNSGQNWLAQNEAARASNEALGAAQQAYLERLSGLQDQFRATSQSLMDKQATRDLPYFVDQLKRQEAAKLDEIEKIRLQNEGKIAVANINAASRSQVANIRAQAATVAKSTSPAGAGSDVSKDYLAILQRAGKTEADYYYKRYKTASEAFYTYSKNAKQDPNVLQGLYDSMISAQKDMNDRALITNTGVTSIAARPFIPQQ